MPREAAIIYKYNIGDTVRFMDEYYAITQGYPFLHNCIGQVIDRRKGTRGLLITVHFENGYEIECFEYRFEFVSEKGKVKTKIELKIDSMFKRQPYYKRMIGEMK